MRSTKRMYRAFQATDGRVKVMTLSGIGVLVAALVLTLAVLPASAGDGAATTTHDVQPVEIVYGGGSGACFANIPGRLPSAVPAGQEIHINNPATGTYYAADGTAVSLVVYASDTKFNFSLSDPAIAAFDVVVNGGANNTHFDYDGNGGPGPQNGDTGLHAPTKGNGNNLYKLSHINICYDTNPLADLSVTKTPVAVNGTDVTTDPFVANVGDVVEFEIVVTNSASSTVPATDVTVVDTVPAGMSLDGLTTGGVAGTKTENDIIYTTYTWEIASLGIGQSETLSIFLKLDSAGQILTNQVSVSGNEPDPTPGNDDAGSVPPVTVTADISGVKFHDHDTDGTRDPSQEEGLAGWTIAAFDVDGVFVKDATTASDGTYTIENLPPGTYTVCEATTTNGLPGSGAGFTWAWSQSLPTGTDCGGFTGYEPAGYSVTLGDDATGIDFGNHTQVTVACSADSDVIVTLGGAGTLDDPLAVMTFPKGCQSTEYTTSFDVGRSGDGDPWSQFVVFGGDPSSTQIIGQTIYWDAEPAVYSEGSLQVPTTQVVLAPGGNPQAVVFCDSLGGDPTSAVSQCLDYRTIAEGGPAPLAAGEIQLTEYYRFLGDPFSWRG